MQKIQILFPEPQMAKLREAARQEDRPISEIVRRATEAWLVQRSSKFQGKAKTQIPVFQGGAVLVESSELRAVAWSDRAGLKDLSRTKDRS